MRACWFPPFIPTWRWGEWLGSPIWGSSREHRFSAPWEGVGRTWDLTAEGGGLCPLLASSGVPYFAPPQAYRVSRSPHPPNSKGSDHCLRKIGAIGTLPPFPAGPPFSAPLRSTPRPLSRPHFAVIWPNGKLFPFLGKYIVPRKIIVSEIKKKNPTTNYSQGENIPLYTLLFLLSPSTWLWIWHLS